MSDEFDNHDESAQDELDDVSEAELAEAAELARALSGKAAQLSDEAAEGAGLLQLRRHAELSSDAFARIETEVLSAARAPRADAQSSNTLVNRVWLWLIAATVPAAAALFLVLAKTSEPAVVGALGELPVPGVEVLQAQASWVNSDVERPLFEREMRDYRAQVLASLDQH